MSSEEIWVVDRVENGVAILVEDDSETVVEVAAELLGPHAVEGAVLRVPVGAVGEPTWEAAVRDDAVESARRSEGQAAIEALKKRDPGGDVIL